MESTERIGLLDVDIKHLLKIIVSRLWIIVLVGVLCASIAVGYAWFFVTPTYRASVQFYVNNQYNESAGFSSSQIVAAQSLADTYMVILRSRSVLEEVAKKTDLGYSYKQLSAMLNSSSINKTEVFQVNVTCTDYQHAARIANTIADVLPDKIASVVDGSSVRVVDRAFENPKPVGPNYRNCVFMGGAVGVALTAILIVLLELMDTTINSEEHLTHVYGSIPLLVMIPDVRANKTKYYRGYYKGYYEMSQQKETPPKEPENKNGGKK